MNGVSSRIAMRLAGRNTLASLLLIGAVLLGALAVHSMMNTSDMSPSAMSGGATGASLLSAPATDTVETSTPISTVAGGLSTAASSIAPILQAACPVSCTTDSLMAGIICAIAVVAVVLAVLLMRPSIRRAVFTQLRYHTSVAAFRVRSPRAPSLLLLSISRT